MSILPACMYVHHICMSDAHRVQEKMSNLLDVQLRMGMSHRAGGGMGPGSSARTSNAFNPEKSYQHGMAF